MKILLSENKLCFACLQEHTVDLVEIIERTNFKDEDVSFVARYEYCSNLDQLLESEEMLKENDLAMKDAYRKKVGLLTSGEIKDIREKFGISQKDFSKILGWGEITITRYENHQVQTFAHDVFLRGIDSNPKEFLILLEKSRNEITERAYKKYYRMARQYYHQKENEYLIKAIEAKYAGYDDELLAGCTGLDLPKVVEMVNYFAKNINSLHLVKLMKLLWYADYLHFKRHERAISGLIYNALPMGATPEAHNLIIELQGIEYEEIMYDNWAYKFKPSPGFKVELLSCTELDVLDAIIFDSGELDTTSVVNKMHEEEAYKQTPAGQPISFIYAKHLSLE